MALHVAAASPISLTIEELDPAALEREKAIFTEQAIASGKPPQVAERMVEGRIRKFYEEAVLLKQAYVRNPDETIELLVAAAAKIGRDAQPHRLRQAGSGRRGRRRKPETSPAKWRRSPAREPLPSHARRWPMPCVRRYR